MANIVKKISTNKKQILVRSIIIGGAVLGVTLAAGLIKVVPTNKTVEAVENVAKAAKKAAE